MSADDVHVDYSTFGRRPWRKVLRVWIAVGRLEEGRRDHYMLKCICFHCYDILDGAS